MEEDAEYLDQVVRDHALVLQTWLRVWISARTDPDVRKVFSRKKVLDELEDGRKSERPDVDEHGPELVVEGRRIFKDENEEISGGGTLEADYTFFYPLTCTYRVSWQSWVTSFINNELNHAQVLISGKYVKASSDEMKSAPYPTLELCRQLHWRN